MTAYEQGLEKIKGALAEAKDQVKQVKIHVEALAQQARDKADAMASAAAKTALAAAVALIIAACISMGAGHCGAKYAPHWGSVMEQVQSITAQ